MEKQRFIKHGIVLRIAAALLCTISLFGISGCAKEKEKDPDTLEAISYYDIDLSGLTLGQYKGVEITKDIRVTDIDITNALYEDILLIESLKPSGGEEHELYSRYKEMRITDRAAESGDNVFISYTGYIDGETFSGGSSSGVSLILGSKSYIDGFEDAVIGKMPGETFDINISFPDPYLGNEDLSGKPVKFTATVQYIYPALDDALAEILALVYEERSGKTPKFTNAEEYLEVKREEIRKSKEEAFDNNASNEILSIIYDNSTFAYYPEALLKNLERTLDNTAAQYGLDRDTYLLYMYGITTEAQYKEFAEYQVGSDCIIAAIIRAENISLTEEEQLMIAKSYANRFDLSSVDELYSLVGETELLNMMLSETVLNFIVDAAVINVVE